MGDRLFSYDTAVLAASGALVGTLYIYTMYIFQASVTASCITMPLTTAFTRLQLEDKRQAKGPITTMIELVSQTSKLVSHYNVFQVRDEGFLTLYRGCQSTLLSISISNFVYFYSFHGLKKFTGAASQNALKDLLFACTAGCYEDTDLGKCLGLY